MCAFFGLQILINFKMGCTSYKKCFLDETAPFCPCIKTIKTSAPLFGQIWGTKKKKKNCRETEGRGGRRRGQIHTWETPFLVPVKKLQHPRGSSSFQVTLQIWFGISSNLENIGISFGNLVWCSSDLGFILLFFFSNQTCVFFFFDRNWFGVQQSGYFVAIFWLRFFTLFSSLWRSYLY